MAALIGGVLRYDRSHDCFVLEGLGDHTAVVWPTGTRPARRGIGVVLPDGRVVRPGDSVRGGGGVLTVDVARQVGVVKASIPRECLGAERSVSTFNPNARVRLGTNP